MTNSEKERQHFHQDLKVQKQKRKEGHVAERASSDLKVQKQKRKEGHFAERASSAPATIKKSWKEC